MGRSRKFQADDVIDNLISLFQARGYEAASFADIVSATGLNRASLYSSFGDKKALFLLALDRYCEGMLDDYREIAATGEAPHGKLVAIFDYAITRLGRAPDTGCLLTNTATEFGPRDADVLERVQTALAGIENILDSVLRADPSVEQPRNTARYLLSVLQGVTVLSKVNPDRRVLSRIAGQAVSRSFA